MLPLNFLMLAGTIIYYLRNLLDTKTPISPSRRYNQLGTKPFLSEDAFTEIKTYHHGLNRNTQYTPQFKDKCNEDILISLLVDEKQPFRTGSIALVFNSIHHSTCALLSNDLQEFHNTKSYPFDSLKQKQAAVAPTTSRTVSSLIELLANLKLFGLDKDPAPSQPPPVKSNVYFTIREPYSSKFKELHFLEFTCDPVKHHKQYAPGAAFNPYKV